MQVVLGYKDDDLKPMQFWELQERYVLYQRDKWSHTAQLLAMLYNLQCTKQSDCKTPDELNPYAETQQGTFGDLVSALT